MDRDYIMMACLAWLALWPSCQWCNSGGARRAAAQAASLASPGELEGPTVRPRPPASRHADSCCQPRFAVSLRLLMALSIVIRVVRCPRRPSRDFDFGPRRDRDFVTGRAGLARARRQQISPKDPAAGPKSRRQAGGVDRFITVGKVTKVLLTRQAFCVEDRLRMVKHKAWTTSIVARTEAAHCARRARGHCHGYEPVTEKRL